MKFLVDALRNKLQRGGATIYYSKLYRNEFFVTSYSDGITDAYVRYHQTGRGGVGFTPGATLRPTPISSASRP